MRYTFTAVQLFVDHTAATAVSGTRQQGNAVQKAHLVIEGELLSIGNVPQRIQRNSQLATSGHNDSL